MEDNNYPNFDIDLYEEIMRENNLSETEKIIIKNYMNMSQDEKMKLKDFMKKLSNDRKAITLDPDYTNPTPDESNRSSMI